MVTATESVATGPTARRRGRAATLLTFLGSMNLAITLLVALAVASVIGTVLQQGQAYEDYLVKFGPFWFEVYRALGLYDVYSAPWFLFILGFLVVSTSVCLVRQTPFMWKEMTRFREHHQERSLLGLSHSRAWDVAVAPDTAAATAATGLQRNGFRVRRKARDGGELVSGMTGASNRLGYVLTHLGIVVICVGGLVDGDLYLQWQYWTGDLAVETEDVPASQVPDDSRLPPRAGAFRGNVTIAEGGSAGVAFLRMGEGYVVQELPFRLELDDFRIEHYDTGQPQSFESDLTLRPDDGGEAVEQTIRVNEPLHYDGYAIYQSNFGDGGSRLDLRAWPLGGGEPDTLETRVDGETTLPGRDDGLRLEVTDFSLFNVHPKPDATNSRDVQNVGPSFTFRLRRATGEAVEYRNYMTPVRVDGNDYFLTGMRRSPGESFRYLHIPADPDGSPQRFMRLVQNLKDPDAVAAAADRAMASMGVEQQRVREQVSDAAYGMIGTLLESGLEAVLAEQRERARARDGQAPERLMDFYRMVLERTLWQVYADVLEREGRDAAEPADEDLVFYENAVSAVTALPDYASPVFLQLRSFDHRQASGLQIARAPGQNIVYTGAALLTAGVFLLFYVAHRRVWCWVRPEGSGSRVVLAGVSPRDPIGFRKVFDALVADVSQRLARDETPPPTSKG